MKTDACSAVWTSSCGEIGGVLWGGKTVEKYGEFYGEEKLIWAASWGDGDGEKEKGKKRFVGEKKRWKDFKWGQRVGGLICSHCRLAEKRWMGWNSKKEQPAVLLHCNSLFCNWFTSNLFSEEEKDLLQTCRAKVESLGRNIKQSTSCSRRWRSKADQSSDKGLIQEAPGIFF